MLLFRGSIIVYIEEASNELSLIPIINRVQKYELGDRAELKSMK
jgi:hypothetical protein